MSIVRRDIRAAVITALETEFSELVYGLEKIDLSTASQAIGVYFPKGEVAHEGVFSQITAEVVVAFHHAQLSSDQQLDDWSAPAMDIIIGLTIPGVIGLVSKGFEFSDDESGSFRSLFLKFEIKYQGN